MENNDIWHQESIEYSLLCAQGVEDEMFQTAYKTNAFTKELVTNYTYILSSFIPKIKKTLLEYYGFSIPGKKPLKTLVNFSDLS